MDLCVLRKFDEIHTGKTICLQRPNIDGIIQENAGYYSLLILPDVTSFPSFRVRVNRNPRDVPTPIEVES